MKIVFLGTNGWYDTVTGNTICILVDTEEYTIILDAGNGIYKLEQYIDFKKPVYLFLSHFHLDHIIGLHIINKFNFHSGLFICGQKDVESILDKVVTAPFTIPIKELDFRTEYIELPNEERLLPFEVKSLPLVHSVPILGFRFRVDKRVITYCADTGFCPNAIELGKGADLLIAECAFKAGQEDINWPHLNPLTAAQIAKEAKAKMLALVHFDAAIYKTKGERQKAEIEAQRIFPKSFITKDNKVIEL